MGRAPAAAVLSPRSAPRLVMACQPTRGGVAVCVRDLSAAAVHDGFDVTVACPPDGDLSGWITGVGASWAPMPLHRRPSLRDFGNLIRLRRLLRDADLVHLHSSKAGAVGRVALATLGRKAPPCVFTPHCWSWLVGGPLAPAYRAFERRASRFADVTIAVSVEEAAAGSEVIGRRLRALRVIENGVALDRYQRIGTTAQRQPDPLIVIVGRLTRQKGLDRAIRALALMPDRRTRLRIVGDGPDARRLASAARRFGVADRVELVGWADPRPHIRAADVVAVPSRWESLSLALLESMACGAAVAATPAAVPTRLADGVAVVPEGETDLAAGLSALLADSPGRLELGRRARATVEARYDITRTVESHRELWQQLLAKSGSSRVKHGVMPPPPLALEPASAQPICLSV